MKKIKTLLIALLVITNLILIGGMIMEEQTYGYCGSKCKHPVYMKSDVAVLTGTIELKKGTTGANVYIDYPEGFNNQNSIVLNQMWSNATGVTPDSKSNNYMSGITNSSGNLVKFRTILSSSDIQIGYWIDLGNNTLNSDSSINYKIALMKYE